MIEISLRDVQRGTKLFKELWAQGVPMKVIGKEMSFYIVYEGPEPGKPVYPPMGNPKFADLKAQFDVRKEEPEDPHWTEERSESDPHYIPEYY